MNLNQPYSDLAVFCYDDLASRCLNNADLVDRVLAAFQAGAENDLQLLATAIDQSDFETAAMTAHRIKGSALNAAAYRMSNVAASIEREALRENAQSLKESMPVLADSFAEFQSARTPTNPVVLPTQDNLQLPTQPH